jgi:hypothetical protein
VDIFCINEVSQAKNHVEDDFFDMEKSKQPKHIKGKVRVMIIQNSSSFVAGDNQPEAT